jgi:mRNA interferase MazF
LLPRRWHLYIVDLEPRIGTKPGKQRPCLAIQPSEFGEAGLESTVVLPLTTKIAPEDAFPLRVLIPKGTCGLKRNSEVPARLSPRPNAFWPGDSSSDIF